MNPFFKIGDDILYGKYKNKRGRVVQFSTNPKGQPLIEIEPVPKGRKQNKIVGLYRIWSVAALEKAQTKEAHMDIAQRVASRFAHGTKDPVSAKVAARYMKQAGIAMGTSWEHGDVRIHRYREVFEVTDIAFAGKRGKKCRVMSLETTPSYKGDTQEWMESMSKALPDYNSYDGIKNFIKDVLVDFPGEIRIGEREVRGVDVRPKGITKIHLQTSTNIEIVSDPLEFLVKSRYLHKAQNPGQEDFWQDTSYYSRDKKGASVFYNWFRANLSEANKMTIVQFQQLWHELGIPYDSH